MAECPFGHDRSEIPISRRGFLKSSLLGVAALTSLALGVTPLGGLVAEAASATPWTEAPFVGDHWEQCHALRDGKTFPHGGPVEEVDVVVVGGGMSGLIAAWRLRGHHVVVLEKEMQAGGNSRFGTWEGIRYPLGALYYSKPTKEIHSFLVEIGLPPVPIPGSVDTLYTKGQFVTHFLGEGVKHAPWPAAEVRAFVEAWKHFAAFNDSKNSPDVPILDDTKKALELDTVTILQYCKSHRFHPHVTRFIDQYVRSCWGVGSEKVSAFAAINFFASEFQPLFACPGGNGGITNQLAALLGTRVRRGAFVDRVVQEANRVRVDYVRNGKPAVLRARQCILASPKHITLRMLADLPHGLQQALQSARYGSYLVGEIFMREPLADSAFDLWVEDRWYTDLCMADWMLTHGKPRKERKTVMVASIPMGEAEGRATLLTTPHDDFAKRLTAEIEKDFPNAVDHIEGIQFARWGHPMVVPYPGYITRVTPTFYKPFGRLWFANSDAHGLPCFESALSAAFMASDGVAHALRRS